MWSNAKINSNRFLTEKNGLDNKDMSAQIVSTMSMIYPSMIWQAEVYNDIDGGSKHWFMCSGCFSFLHFQSKYNVVVSALPKGT